MSTGGGIAAFVKPGHGKYARYRSTIAIIVALFALSAVMMAVFSRSDPPPIAGAPAYLYSIPSEADKGVLRSALNGPLAVAAYGDRIAVADSGEGKVKIYTGAGAYVAEIDLNELPGVRRAYPTGLAYDDEGRLFVSEIQSDRIYVFDSGLGLLYRFPEERAHIELVQPIALSIRGADLFVTDVGDSSVKVFSLDGTLAREFASPEKRKVALAFPNGVGVNSEGVVFVADSNNRKVIAFDAQGRERFTVNYPFSLPRGIGVDGLDRVHVVDTFAHRVDVFDAGGRFLFAYGSAENPEDGELGFPNGISVDSRTARIYVTDRSANKIQVWGWP